MAFGLKKKTKNADQEEEKKKLANKVKDWYRRAYDNASARHAEWEEDMSAYKGDYFIENMPEYKSQEVSNYIFSTVETIKPVMLANNPKFMAIPSTEKGVGTADMVQRALTYEWSRAKMFSKLNRALGLGLQAGTVVIYLPWDTKSDKGLGNVVPKIISPFNFFPDENATDMDDIERAQYADYISVGEAIRMYPEYAQEIKDQALQPSDKYLRVGKEDVTKATMVLCIETYLYDWETETNIEQDEEGNNVEVTKMKYPNGRKIVTIGDLVVEDGENIYKDGKFPFVMWKCYDNAGEFWGTSEVKHVKSPQKHLNELTNQILDAAKLTANSPWVIDKNAGIPKGSLVNRQGLVIRKNPGTEVKRIEPGNMPAYLENVIARLQKDMEQIPGVYDVTRGERPTGITAAAAIEALNEQAQGRIKLKVQAMEQMLGELGVMWLSRIQQFWDSKRDIYVMGADYKPQFSQVDKYDFDGDFDIVIVAGSTMPTNRMAKLQTMIQLAQTNAEDGLPMIDRQTVLENADLGNLQEVLTRFAKIKEEQAQNQQPVPPSQSISFKDLPMDGKIQLAAKAGITLNPQALQEEETMKKVEQETDLQSKHMQMDSQARNDSQNALQQEQESLQSESEGQVEGSADNSAEQPDEMSMILETISQMNPEELAQFIQDNPEMKPLIEQIYQLLTTEQPQ